MPAEFHALGSAGTSRRSAAGQGAAPTAGPLTAMPGVYTATPDSDQPTNQPTARKPKGALGFCGCVHPASVPWDKLRYRAAEEGNVESCIARGSGQKALVRAQVCVG